MHEKIDIVYLWVDGSDPVWREKRQSAIKNVGNQTLTEHGNVEGRFRNNGELLYSLRSLEKYFPEHGDIYIVTDNQVPDFLRENTDIKIIYHEDFMDPNTLPTFSSKHIESCLVDIPGISEIFIAFNDDFFLGPDFEVSDLVDQKPVYYFSPWSDEHIHPPLISAGSSENILREFYPHYKNMSLYAVHTPRVIVKKDFLQMREEFPSLFESIQKETFRNVGNPSLLADMYPRRMIHHNKGVIGVKEDVYIESSIGDYNRLLEDFSSVAFFCINDTGDDISSNDSTLLRISKVLSQLFPHKSCFEK